MANSQTIAALARKYHNERDAILKRNGSAFGPMAGMGPIQFSHEMNKYGEELRQMFVPALSIADWEALHELSGLALGIVRMEQGE